MDAFNNGQPFEGLNDGTNTTDIAKYSNNGQPYEYLFTTSAPAGGNLKTWNGVSWANIKTFNGKAVASVKLYNGISTQ